MTTLGFEMIRREFPIFKTNPDLVYLDSASSAQKPSLVIEAIEEFYQKRYANVHRGLYRLSQEASEQFEQARVRVARFIGAQPQEIVFTSGATESINLVAQGSLNSGLKSGHNIVITELEHHSNIVPWQLLTRTRGIELRWISYDHAQGGLNLKLAKTLIDSETHLVAITGMSNVLGVKPPVAHLATLARSRGARVLVDATQLVVHQKIELSKLGVDYLVFSSHKLYGPTGTGVLWVNPKHHQSFEPVLTGSQIVSAVSKKGPTWRDFPEKLEPGTPNISGVVGLARAIDWVEKTRLKHQALDQMEGLLAQKAAQSLKQIPGVRVLSDHSNCNPILSFVFEHVHPHDVAEYLGQNSIAIRAGHHCAEPLHQSLGFLATCRVSFGYYSNLDDVNRLVRSLIKLARYG